MCLRVKVLRPFLLFTLITIFGAAAYGQNKATPSHCTGDARGTIWPFIQKFEMFSSNWKCDEKLVLTSFKAGISRAFIVRGNGSGICGATGNCPTWIVGRVSGHPKVILKAGSITDWYEFNYLKGKSYPELGLRYRMGAGDLYYAKYIYDRNKYRLISCSSETYGTDGIRKLARLPLRACS